VTHEPNHVERRTHGAELRHLGAVLGGLVVLSAATYAVSQAEAVRPWISGEPLPLIHLFSPDTVVLESATGEVITRDADWMEAPIVQTGPVAMALDGWTPDPLPVRSPAVPTPLLVPQGSLDHWFARLAEAEDGQPGRLVRALNWGDSTIAGDGIVGTVRTRLQAKFGDGGPGFLAVQVDPRWAIRPGVARWPKGDWLSRTITFGEADTPRYGLAGTVSTATGEARSTLGGLEIDGQRQPLHRFDVHYQVQPGGGAFSAVPKGGGGVRLGTAAERYGDRFFEILAPKGAEYLWIKTLGDGPVTLYGVALETSGPGMTWENLGVAGSGLGSMGRQSHSHLKRQIERRQPDLVVYMTGGNELGYQTLEQGEGEKYKAAYIKVFERFREGSPGTSCMVITPLDQATRVRGQVVTKTLMAKLERVQREAAEEMGCAWWSAWHAMGGEGSFGRWLQMDPPLAWTDLMHLTETGLDLVGQSFADAIEQSYSIWRHEHPDAGYAGPGPVHGPELPPHLK
jgi:hypothetical protein